MRNRIIKESIDRFYDNSIHIESRTLYIGGEIDETSAERAIKGLHLLDGAETIKILLNSVGGDCQEGLAIYDAIISRKNHVTIEVLGIAASMGSIILQAADERIVHPNASIMIHDPTLCLEQTSRTAEAWIKENKRIRTKFYKIYAERSKKTAKYWERRCTHDYFLTAEDAIHEGLADRVFTREQ